MDLYQHDSSSTFQFVIRGKLAGGYVANLEHAWLTAQSVLGDKELVVDVTGLTSVDASGVELLQRMRRAGARLEPSLPAEFQTALRNLAAQGRQS